MHNRQKAFWVHNSTQSEANVSLPAIGGPAHSTMDQRNATSLVSARSNRHSMENSRTRNDAYNPIPISKQEQLTKEEGGDVKLVQQYIMVRGKLQPALKYIAPNPMYNRYAV